MLLAVVARRCSIVPSSEYIFLPGPRAPGRAARHRSRAATTRRSGGVYFVDVVVRKATLLERLFGGLHDGADLYPASAVNPPGVGDQQRRRIDLQDMQRSQQIAAAVALRAAGKKVVLRPTGARVDRRRAGQARRSGSSSPTT